jgi:hypothetical protein
MLLNLQTVSMTWPCLMQMALQAGRVFVLIFLWEKDVARSTNCVYDTACFIIGEDSKSNVVAVILGCHGSVVVRITKRVRARML